MEKVIHRLEIAPSGREKNICTISNMSDEVKAEPAWKTDPALAHIPITEEGVARWRARFKALDETWTPEQWEEERRKYGITRR